MHTLPKDMKMVIARKAQTAALWADITPLARNEWICWVTSGKQAETRTRRLKVMIDKMSRGERRPCCWAGCPHR